MILSAFAEFIKATSAKHDHLLKQSKMHHWGVDHIRHDRFLKWAKQAEKAVKARKKNGVGRPPHVNLSREFIQWAS